MSTEDRLFMGITQRGTYFLSFNIRYITFPECHFLFPKITSNQRMISS